LCIARAIAVDPEVLVFDESTASLDPISTSKIEDLMVELSKKLTIIAVTHNLQQAARVSEYTLFLMDGEVIEYDKTNIMFTNPKDKKTQDYIMGRFG
jgi:phosphate transport system ATP-binding protein